MINNVYMVYIKPISHKQIYKFIPWALRSESLSCSSDSIETIFDGPAVPNHFSKRIMQYAPKQISENCMNCQTLRRECGQVGQIGIKSRQQNSILVVSFKMYIKKVLKPITISKSFSHEQ